MPYVKTELYDFIADKLQHEASEAQSRLANNKYELAKLAEKQKYLKDRAKHAQKMADLFKKKAKPTEG